MLPPALFYIGTTLSTRKLILTTSSSPMDIAALFSVKDKVVLVTGGAKG